MKSSTTRNNKIIAAAVWISIWQLASIVVNQPLFLPSPMQTLAALFTLAQSSEFYLSVLATLIRVLLGLTLSTLIGVVLGILSAKRKWLDIFLSPLISLFKSVPVVSFVFLIILYLNSSLVPIVVCIILCFPIVYTNTQKGILSIDIKLIEMAELHKVSSKKILTHIKIPAIMPNLLSALLICVGFSWKAVVTAEVLSATLNSIGFNLYTSKIYVETQGLFAWSLVIVLLSIFIENITNKLYENSKWYIGK